MSHAANVKRYAAATAFLAFSLGLAADVFPQAAPAANAQRYFAAITAEQWDSAAAFVDPVSQRTFRDRVLTYLLLVAEQRRAIRRSMQGSGSGGFAGFGMDSVPTAARLAKYGQWRIGVYPGTPTIQELAGLSPAELLARSYAASSILCMEGVCEHEPPLPGRALVLGAVIENDSVAHVLYRETGSDTSTLARGVDRWRVEVMQFFKRDDRWLVHMERGPLPSLFSLMDEKMGLTPPGPVPKPPNKKP